MKYNDKVRVKSGFYEGMEGTVIREKFLWLNSWMPLIDFIVKLQIEWDEHEIVFPESNLELIK
jgi:hypothetical protein